MSEEEKAKAKWNTDFHNPIIRGFIAGFLSMVGDKLGVMEYSPTGSQIPEQVFDVMSYFTADPVKCESILPERATSESWRDLRSLSECLTNLIPTYDESTNRFLPFGVKRVETCDTRTLTAMKVEAAGGNSGVEEDRPTTDDHMEAVPPEDSEMPEESTAEADDMVEIADDVEGPAECQERLHDAIGQALDVSMNHDKDILPPLERAAKLARSLGDALAVQRETRAARYDSPAPGSATARIRAAATLSAFPARVTNDVRMTPRSGSSGPAEAKARPTAAVPKLTDANRPGPAAMHEAVVNRPSAQVANRSSSSVGGNSGVEEDRPTTDDYMEAVPPEDSEMPEE
jgi:hypothetical protein